MTKEDFLVQLERGRDANAALPVTSSLLNHLLEALKKGDPAWWVATQKAWEKRKFVSWSEAWGLFLTGVHYEALRDEENPLVPYFPSCGGTDEADPAPAFAEFLKAPPVTFFENLASRHRRNYSASRSGLWLSPAALFFQGKRGLPYYLVEVNAGAGLNLIADDTRPAKGFNSGLIAARIGLDPDPLPLEDISHRRWLTASATPDSTTAIAELDAAADLLLAHQAEEAAFVQLAACAPDAAPAFIAKNIPADDADAGILVYNMATTARMNDSDYEKYKLGMLEMLRPWGDRGLWVEVESVRGELYSRTFQARVHRVVDGTLRQHIMASLDFNANKAEYDIKATGEFLALGK